MSDKKSKDSKKTAAQEAEELKAEAIAYLVAKGYQHSQPTTLIGPDPAETAKRQICVNLLKEYGFSFAPKKEKAERKPA